MKKNSVKALSLIIAVLLIGSLSACKKNSDKTTTTEPYSYNFGDTPGIETQAGTAAEMESTTDVKVSYIQIPDDLLHMIIESDGTSVWDGEYYSFTAEQKSTLENYFTAQGKEIEFMDDGVYEVIIGETVPVSSSSAATTNTTTAIAGMTTTQSNSNAGTTTAAAVVPTSVYISEVVKNVKTGAVFMLNAEVLPVNTANRAVSWKSSNPSVASVSADGKVTAKAGGTAVITCTANAANNLKASCKVTVTEIVPQINSAYKYDAANQFYYIENGTAQRKIGLESLYGGKDYTAAVKYNAVHIKFNYGGIDWLIRLCKGQYGSTYTGSEISVFTKAENQPSRRYECASDSNSLNMEMTLYRGTKQLFSRGYKTYWWVNGYVAGGLSSGENSTDLTVVAGITFKNLAMRNAFVKAFTAKGFTQKDYNGINVPDRFSTSGNRVYFNWTYIGHPDLSGKITFYTGGGSKIPFIRGIVGQEVDAPSNPVRAGYVFKGWKPSLPATYPKNDISVEAMWAVAPATTAVPETTLTETEPSETTVQATTLPETDTSATGTEESTIS